MSSINKLPYSLTIVTCQNLVSVKKELFLAKTCCGTIQKVVVVVFSVFLVIGALFADLIYCPIVIIAKCFCAKPLQSNASSDRSQATLKLDQSNEGPSAPKGEGKRGNEGIDSKATSKPKDEDVIREKEIESEKKSKDEIESKSHEGVSESSQSEQEDTSGISKEKERDKQDLQSDSEAYVYSGSMGDENVRTLNPLRAEEDEDSPKETNFSGGFDLKESKEKDCDGDDGIKEIDDGIKEIDDRIKKMEDRIKEIDDSKKKNDELRALSDEKVCQSFRQLDALAGTVFNPPTPRNFKNEEINQAFNFLKKELKFTTTENHEKPEEYLLMGEQRGKYFSTEMNKGRVQEKIEYERQRSNLDGFLDLVPKKVSPIAWKFVNKQRRKIDQKQIDSLLSYTLPTTLKSKLEEYKKGERTRVLLSEIMDSLVGDEDFSKAEMQNILYYRFIELENEQLELESKKSEAVFKEKSSELSNLDKKPLSWNAENNKKLLIFEDEKKQLLNSDLSEDVKKIIGNYKGMSLNELIQLIPEDCKDSLYSQLMELRSSYKRSNELVVCGRKKEEYEKRRVSEGVQGSSKSRGGWNAVKNRMNTIFPYELGELMRSSKLELVDRLNDFAALKSNSLNQLMDSIPEDKQEPLYQELLVLRKPKLKEKEKIEMINPHQNIMVGHPALLYAFEQKMFDFADALILSGANPFTSINIEALNYQFNADSFFAIFSKFYDGMMLIMKGQDLNLGPALEHIYTTNLDPAIMQNKYKKNESYIFYQEHNIPIPMIENPTFGNLIGNYPKQRLMSLHFLGLLIRKMILIRENNFSSTITQRSELTQEILSPIPEELRKKCKDPLDFFLSFLLDAGIECDQAMVSWFRFAMKEPDMFCTIALHLQNACQTRCRFPDPKDKQFSDRVNGGHSDSEASGFYNSMGDGNVRILKPLKAEADGDSSKETNFSGGFDFKESKEKDCDWDAKMDAKIDVNRK